MSGPARPGTPDAPGAPRAPRPNRTPYFVVIGVLALALIGAVIWALIPSDGDPSSEPSAQPTPSATQTSSAPEPEPAPTPSDAPSTDMPATEEPPTQGPSEMPSEITDGYAILREILPKQLENWKLEVQEAVGESQPVYKDGDRRISFVPMGDSVSPEEMGEGQKDLQKIDGGACYLNPRSTGETKMITCAIAPKAAQGQTFLMSSRYAEIDEMVRLAKAIIAG